MDSLAIMFYTGIGGIATALLVSCADGGISHMVEVIKKTDADLWVVLMIVSALGILGYFTFVASLKFISATLSEVTRTIEIGFTYICQGLATSHHQTSLLCFDTYYQF